MTSKLPQLSRLVIKLFELAGAGTASAAGAFLFSQIAQPGSPASAPLPPVQVVPPSVELVQVMRKENALLIEQMLKDREDGHRREAEASAPRTAPMPVSKPIKAAITRKESKPERASTAESKPRLEEPQLPANRPVFNIAAHPDTLESHATAPNSAETEVPATAARPRTFGWFGSSEPASDAPRPPMPVGDVQLRAM
jgi:hypothetical protein